MPKSIMRFTTSSRTMDAIFSAPLPGEFILPGIGRKRYIVRRLSIDKGQARICLRLTYPTSTSMPKCKKPLAGLFGYLIVASSAAAAVLLQHFEDEAQGVVPSRS